MDQFIVLAPIQIGDRVARPAIDVANSLVTHDLGDVNSAKAALKSQENAVKHAQDLVDH
ncbi:MAG: hypothetical protein ABSG53_31815 [Thermoguttaceae bacterium]